MNGKLAKKIRRYSKRNWMEYMIFLSLKATPLVHHRYHTRIDHTDTILISLMANG